MSKTMFGSAKHKRLAEIVTITNPDAARGSVVELWREYNGAKTKDKKLRVARATRLAANRAEASAKKRPLSVRERKELKAVATIYAKAASGMFRQYKTVGR